MPEHGLHAVGPLRVFAEAWLALDGHPCVLGNLPQLVCEVPVASTRSGKDGITPTELDEPDASPWSSTLRDATVNDPELLLKVESKKTQLAQLKRTLRGLKRADKGLVGILRTLAFLSV